MFWEIAPKLMSKGLHFGGLLGTKIVEKSFREGTQKTPENRYPKVGPKVEKGSQKRGGFSDTFGLLFHDCFPGGVPGASRVPNPLENARNTSKSLFYNFNLI